MGFRRAAASTPTATRRVELLRGVPVKGFPSQNALLVWLTLAVLLPMLLLMALLPKADAEPSLQLLWSRLLAEPSFIFAALGLVGVIVYAILTSRYERLIVSELGIEYRSPLRGPLSFLHRLYPDWRLRWEEIDAVGLLKPRVFDKAAQWKLTLVADGQCRELQPLGWVDPAERSGQRTLSFWRLLRPRGAAIEMAVHGTPLVRAITAHGYALGGAAPPVAAEYDLMSHRGMVAVVVLFFAAGLYALVDTLVTGPYAYIGAPPADAFVAMGLAAAIVGWKLTADAPRKERLAVLVLFAAAAAAAAYPGQLRLNAATDRDGGRVHVYQWLGVGHYRSADPGLPELRFGRFMEYWQQFGAGSTHEFELLQGAAGFYQLHERPLQERMREFYRSQP